MIPDDMAYLRHILTAVTQIEQYTRGMSESEFQSRPMVHDAVVRQIQVVDKAIRSVSAEFQNLHPKLPWSKVMKACNEIVRDDFSVNLPLAWNAAQDDLPLLKQLIKRLLS
jgi:uncharacterized protein with HEPN domain